MSTITEELQSMSPSAIIEMYELDATIQGAGILRFHAGINGVMQPLVWAGQTYSPLPIAASGFDTTIKGSLPRPKMQISNSGSLMSYEVMTYDDLVGAKLTRRRTFAKYLDAVNFTGGVNASADVNQKYPDDIWYVDQKTSENMLMIEWTLASPFDLIGVMLPRRQVIQNSCPWAYRGSECGYTGAAYFDTNDVSTSQASDVCGKRLSSCKARYGTYAVLPFGGFPGVIRYA